MGKILEFKDGKLQRKEAGVRKVFGLIGEDTGAEKISAQLSEYEPNAVPVEPYHYHENRETVYIIIEGSGTLKLNGVEYPLKSNSVVFIPPGDKHKIIRVGEKGLKNLSVISPFRSTDFFPVQE